MNKLKITMTGTASLIMHNARLADPLDPISREKDALSRKRRKTDEDALALSKVEWQGSLYFDPEIGPYIPGQNVYKALIEAARKSRDGRRVEQGMFIVSDFNPLAYVGPRTLNELWADQNFVFRTSVKQQQSRIIRTRAIFPRWATEVDAAYDPNVLDVREVTGFAETAGLYIGIGDWRPRFGRFTTRVEEV
jgi:hypothetical protein